MSFKIMNLLDLNIYQIVKYLLYTLSVFFTQPLRKTIENRGKFFKSITDILIKKYTFKAPKQD
jgi:hypothetical protein